MTHIWIQEEKKDEDSIAAQAAAAVKALFKNKGVTVGTPGRHWQKAPATEFTVKRVLQ